MMRTLRCLQRWRSQGMLLCMTHLLSERFCAKFDLKHVSLTYSAVPVSSMECATQGQHQHKHSNTTASSPSRKFFTMSKRPSPKSEKVEDLFSLPWSRCTAWMVTSLQYTRY